MNQLLILIGLIIVSLIRVLAAPNESSDVIGIPENGFVPDKTTAISIAVAVWTPIYGKESIKSEKPYKAELKGDVWRVKGSLKKHWYNYGMLKGGVAEAEISKLDGRILSVNHGK
jgi:hypothetical protein